MPTLIVGLSGGVPSTPMIELESSFYLAKFSEYEKKIRLKKLALRFSQWVLLLNQVIYPVLLSVWSL